LRFQSLLWSVVKPELIFAEKTDSF